MATEAEDDSLAAHRLRLLREEFVSQSGCCGEPPATRPSRPAHSNAPLNLGILDHIVRTRAEVEQHVRTEVPGAGPLPPEEEAIYAWAREMTAHLEPQRQQARDAVIYRQSLEHAVAMGNHDVVRPHPCPACGCWGLSWDTRRQAAVCLNRRCTGDDGQSRTWPLARLAAEAVAKREMLKNQAT